MLCVSQFRGDPACDTMRVLIVLRIAALFKHFLFQFDIHKLFCGSFIKL